MAMPDVQWKCVQFDELSPRELYSILQLRTEVFVMEQDCVYQDMDDCDQQAWHVSGMLDEELICYARILPPAMKYKTASIGRVITKKSVRGDGYGKLVMEKSLEHCQQLWPSMPITISAQQYLEKFYCELGFETVSDAYLEDGIPHIEMHLQRENDG